MTSLQQLTPVGTEVSKNSKQGGGIYVVIGHINCDRCNTEIELREVIEPNKRQRKNGTYYEEYAWCHECGLYQSNKRRKHV